MSPRSYRMARRAQAAAHTRRRIVEATAALHAEKGVAATTFRDIAARADVGLGTVYHHFPTYDDVISACGAHSMAAARIPQPDLFDAVQSPTDRVRTLVRELFAFYSRAPHFGAVRAERRNFVSLDQAFRHEEEMRRKLIDSALRGVRAGARARAVAFSALDVSMYESLTACGLSHDAAVREITALLLHRLNLTRSPR